MRHLIYLGSLFFSSSLYAAVWQSEVAPYLWGTSLKGSVHMANHKVAVDESFFDLLKDLKFGAMLWAATYHENFGLFFNGLYSKV